MGKVRRVFLREHRYEVEEPEKDAIGRESRVELAQHPSIRWANWPHMHNHAIAQHELAFQVGGLCRYALVLHHVLHHVLPYRLSLSSSYAGFGLFIAIRTLVGGLLTRYRDTSSDAESNCSGCNR